MLPSSWSLLGFAVTLVIAFELIAVDDTELGQQFPHWSTAKRMEQPYTGKHALHAALWVRSSPMSCLYLHFHIFPSNTGRCLHEVRVDSSQPWSKSFVVLCIRARNRACVDVQLESCNLSGNQLNGSLPSTWSSMAQVFTFGQSHLCSGSGN